MSLLRLTLRLTGILLLQVLVPAHLAIWKITGRMPLYIARAWMRGMLVCLGVHVHRSGTPSKASPTLFVSNHVSYIDIIVLAAYMDAFFISKDDVRDWPGIGKLAGLRGTVYINREAVLQAGDLCKYLHGHLRKHDLILFPEGTTGDGETVLDFKTSLFCMVMEGREQEIPVQPIAICYSRDVRGRRLDGERTEEYGWYGDAELAPHLLQVLKAPGVHVDLNYLDVIEAGSHKNRKQIAAEARERIDTAVRDSWESAGRPRIAL